ncbi:tctex1 domain-containing protein 4-like isoform X2 [Anopheles albimanus]|uniref:tctex1 domain-containing protein 4-like isoform X2 n=1 Tax=Anopheles albimanus TaxID=7167 RepID=UPI0016408518|nr:tctex1 domain-containing protein 4-like isoform X2 [Anopheles albimanus]
MASSPSAPVSAPASAIPGSTGSVTVVAPAVSRKKTGKFLGSALNITNRYRANSSSLSKICEDIKTRVKELKFDRYKIIVTVTIGERYMQGLKAISQFLWDPEKDSYASCIYDASPSLVAVGTIYAIYFD